MAKSLKEKLNERPAVVKYTGPLADFEFETSARTLLVGILAKKLANHGLYFTTLTYYSKQTGVSITQAGNVKNLTALKYKIVIEGSSKKAYWEVDFSSNNGIKDLSNIVIAGVPIRVTDFKKMCELKTALLFL